MIHLIPGENSNEEFAIYARNQLNKYYEAHKLTRDVQLRNQMVYIGQFKDRVPPSISSMQSLFISIFNFRNQNGSPLIDATRFSGNEFQKSDQFETVDFEYCRQKLFESSKQST
jgi:hypothetical protein